jgi:HAD superfamily hydrolase (TIGR01509 family)
LLNVTGGRERLRADMAGRADAPVTAAEREALVTELHRRKTEIYTALVREAGLPLRPGVLELITEAREAGLRQAITTTTGRANVDALLGLHFGPRWRELFEVAICGEDVGCKKPDPEVFQRALQALGLGPLEAVALEDSPGGVAAAIAADVPVVVPRSAYFARATIEGAIAMGPGLHTREAGARPWPGRTAPSRWTICRPGTRRWTTFPSSARRVGTLRRDGPERTSARLRMRGRQDDLRFQRTIRHPSRPCGRSSAVSNHHGHQTRYDPRRFLRTQAPPDPGRIHRGPAERRARREADDVELEDVRLHQVPRQLQDRRGQARSAIARPGQMQQLPRRDRPRGLTLQAR